MTEIVKPPVPDSLHLRLIPSQRFPDSDPASLRKPLEGEHTTGGAGSHLLQNLTGLTIEGDPSGFTRLSSLCSHSDECELWVHVIPPDRQKCTSSYPSKRRQMYERPHIVITRIEQGLEFIWKKVTVTDGCLSEAIDPYNRIVRSISPVNGLSEQRVQP